MIGKNTPVSIGLTIAIVGAAWTLTTFILNNNERFASKTEVNNYILQMEKRLDRIENKLDKILLTK